MSDFFILLKLELNFFFKLVGNSQKEYEKAIVSYCIRNQSRFKDTLGKFNFLNLINHFWVRKL